MKRGTIIAVLAVTLLAGGARADEQYAGRWKRTSLKLTVKVESWGEDCGPEPTSYGSNKEVETDVVSQGKHLVFSTGNLRTDRCMSPNPRLQSVSESSGGGSWKRVCQTPSSDSKAERVDYSLNASGANRLDYKALSRFDWTLKGDHCVAVLEETRAFVRVAEGQGKAQDEPPATGKPAAGKTEKQLAADDEGTECAVHGPARRLAVAPREARIGPGERVCFAVHGFDENGCRFPVNATWVVTQDDQEVGGLLSRGGCFSAGATAADSEGVYEVAARFEGKKSSAWVTVAFPDLGDLLAARLHPVDDGEADTDAAPATAAPGALPLPAPVPIASAPASGGNTLLLLVVIGAIVLAAGALLVFVLVIRGRARRPVDDDDDWNEAREPNHPRPPRQELPSGSLPPEPAPRRQSGAEGALQCPKCKSTFPAGAKFCPHDGSTLVAAALAPTGPDGDPPGMICPKCHRPYEPGSRFCPHDKELLVPYPVWRERQRGL
ncbi:MAG TPA: zinc ribbon domain-containing protein [Polyangia bacterium]|nr:zinc ribbon domain-containing protein [Polyangia bacterium]